MGDINRFNIQCINWHVSYQNTHLVLCSVVKLSMLNQFSCNAKKMSKSRVSIFCIMNYRTDLIPETHLNLFYSGTYKGGSSDCIQTALSNPVLMNYTWLMDAS